MFVAIHFKHLGMSGDWTQSAGTELYLYTANKPSILVVMEEVKAGTNLVWHFSLKKGDIVTVNYGDSQVHVPALPDRTGPASSHARMLSMLKARAR